MATTRAMGALLDGALGYLGGSSYQTGSIQANAQDLVAHAIEGDVASADLDAVTLAIQAADPSAGEEGAVGVMDSVLNRTYATSDAVIAWDAITTIEESLF